jgi:hypothetical protein
MRRFESGRRLHSFFPVALRRAMDSNAVRESDRRGSPAIDVHPNVSDVCAHETLV